MSKEDYALEINELKDTIVKTIKDIEKLEIDKKEQNKSYNELIKRKKEDLSAHLSELNDLEEK